MSRRGRSSPRGKSSAFTSVPQNTVRFWGSPGEMISLAEYDETDEFLAEGDLVEETNDDSSYEEDEDERAAPPGPLFSPNGGAWPDLGGNRTPSPNPDHARVLLGQSLRTRSASPAVRDLNDDSLHARSSTDGAKVDVTRTFTPKPRPRGDSIDFDDDFAPEAIPLGRTKSAVAKSSVGVFSYAGGGLIGLQGATREARVLRKDYWLEQLDSKHRYGYYLQPFFDYWQRSGDERRGQEQDQGQGQSFFQWLDGGVDNTCPERVTIQTSTGDEKDIYKVALDSAVLVWQRSETARDTCRIKPSGGVLFCRSELIPDSRQSLQQQELRCRSVRTRRRGRFEQGGDGWVPLSTQNREFVFVVSLDAKLYGGFKVKPNDDGETEWDEPGFFHSSLLGGDDVRVAGKLGVGPGGRLRMIEPHSGHYQPTVKDVHYFLALLDRTYGVDLSAVELKEPKKWAQQWPFAGQVRILTIQRISLQSV